MFRGVSRHILRAIGVGGAGRPSTIIAGLAAKNVTTAAARPALAPLATRFFGTAADPSSHGGVGDMAIPVTNQGPSHLQLASLLEREVGV